MIKVLALMLSAGPLAAQESVQMLDLLAPHCWPYIETGAKSCGVFGLDIAPQEFMTATTQFAGTVGMTQGASADGRAEYLKARDDGDVTMLIAMAVPSADVAAINAMHLPSGDWSNTVLGEN